MQEVPAQDLPVQHLPVQVSAAGNAGWLAALVAFGVLWALTLLVGLGLSSDQCPHVAGLAGARFCGDAAVIAGVLLGGTAIAALVGALAFARARQRRLLAQLAQAQAEADATQSQLLRSEKMASLGQLVASVAHEINTPIAAVKSSGQNVSDALVQLEATASPFETLDLPTRSLFAQLMGHAQSRVAVLSSREERALVRELAAQLTAAGVSDANPWASLLVQLNAHAVFADYLPLLRHAQSELIMQRAYSVAALFSSAANINTAVERVSKIVAALKTYSRVNPSGEMVLAPLQEGVETVLTIYQNQIKRGTELVCRFEEVPAVRCWPDELNQVWTNLIHNALQAMNHQGTLTIHIGRAGAGEALVSVGDTGGGHCGVHPRQDF